MVKDLQSRREKRVVHLYTKAALRGDLKNESLSLRETAVSDFGRDATSSRATTPGSVSSGMVAHHVELSSRPAVPSAHTDMLRTAKEG